MAAGKLDDLLDLGIAREKRAVGTLQQDLAHRLAACFARCAVAILDLDHRQYDIVELASHAAFVLQAQRRGEDHVCTYRQELLDIGHEEVVRVLAAQLVGAFDNEEHAAGSPGVFERCLDAAKHRVECLGESSVGVADDVPQGVLVSHIRLESSRELGEQSEQPRERHAGLCTGLHLESEILRFLRCDHPFTEPVAQRFENSGVRHYLLVLQPGEQLLGNRHQHVGILNVVAVETGRNIDFKREKAIRAALNCFEYWRSSVLLPLPV
jgi:hypothetical protein